ncbi:MAG: hypothetical protein Q8936_19335 [Bacillota bacterium]|nr:hypothetical protein [Bacillota bacterium]
MNKRSERKKISFYRVKYRGTRILLGYCKYNNFQYYATKAGGYIIVCINDSFSRRDKRELLHRAIRGI